MPTDWNRIYSMALREEDGAKRLRLVGLARDALRLRLTELNWLEEAAEKDTIIEALRKLSLLFPEAGSN